MSDSSLMPQTLKKVAQFHDILESIRVLLVDYS